ncbi:hypothetical protein BJV78DRAFT_833138 [Lactifluus subvellereus]|nr:hypothetical protein BJV78DRAFT_833138 [Lactifluus subvellereus]
MDIDAFDEKICMRVGIQVQLCALRNHTGPPAALPDGWSFRFDNSFMTELCTLVQEEVDVYTRGGAEPITQLINTCVIDVFQAMKGSARQPRMRPITYNRTGEAHARNISESSLVQGFMARVATAMWVIFSNGDHPSRWGYDSDSDVYKRKCLVS